jgi:hypothetical protein
MMLAMVLGENVEALRALVVGVVAADDSALSPDGANNEAALDLLLAASAAEPTILLSALSPPIAAMAPN